MKVTAITLLAIGALCAMASPLAPNNHHNGDPDPFAYMSSSTTTHNATTSSNSAKPSWTASTPVATNNSTTTTVNDTPPSSITTPAATVDKGLQASSTGSNEPEFQSWTDADGHKNVYWHWLPPTPAPELWWQRLPAEYTYTNTEPLPPLPLYTIKTEGHLPQDTDDPKQRSKPCNGWCWFPMACVAPLGWRSDDFRRYGWCRNLTEYPNVDPADIMNVNRWKEYAKSSGVPLPPGFQARTEEAPASASASSTSTHTSVTRTVGGIEPRATLEGKSPPWVWKESRTCGVEAPCPLYWACVDGRCFFDLGY